MNAVKSANYAKVKARQLQNALYLASNGNPRWRFHALYDKVHRGRILWEAWKRVKWNGEGCVDGNGAQRKREWPPTRILPQGSDFADVTEEHRAD